MTAESRNEFKLQSNWNTVKAWKDANRYEFVKELEARGLYAAAVEPQFGIMDWIRKRW